MRWISRRATKSALIAASTIVIGAVGASAALGLVVRATGDDNVDYKQQNFSQPQGAHSAFENEDSGATFQYSHSVLSDDSLGFYKLFRSKTILPGSTTPIKGTQYLTTGDYTFHCSVHPAMQATLHVTGAGTPVARPDIEVTIKTKTLRKAWSLHGVKVLIDAATKSQNVGVRVEFKSDGKKAGFAKNIDLAAGGSKTVRIHFNPSANSRVRHHLADHDTLKIKAKAIVPFGKSDSDSQTLGF